MKKFRIEKIRNFFISGCRKTMLQKKDNRAAGELEGAKAPLEIGLIAIKNA
jgi:hypothetical protein